MPYVANQTILQTALIYGINSVREALLADSRPVKRIYLEEGHKRRAAVEEIRNLARQAGIRVDVLARKAFSGKCPAKAAQGVAAETWTKKPLPLDALLDIPARKEEKSFFILLDGVEDPRNLGAIIRTAEASGVHGIVLPSRRSATLGPTASKTSAGAMESMNFSVVTNIKSAISIMKDRGIFIVGVEAGKGHSPWSVELVGPVAVVLGGEGRGIRPTVLSGCDLLVSLPQIGQINSLNVSVATGMLLYEILRQRAGALGVKNSY